MRPLLFLLVAGCAAGDKGDSGSSSDGLLSEGGLYSLVPTWDPDPPATGDAVLSMEISEAEDNSPLAGASLTVTPWMTDMGHGVSGDVLIAEDGEGQYAARFAFSMPGTWQITVIIAGDAGEDQVVFDVDVL